MCFECFSYDYQSPTKPYDPNKPAKPKIKYKNTKISPNSLSLAEDTLYPPTKIIHMQTLRPNLYYELDNRERQMIQDIIDLWETSRNTKFPLTIVQLCSYNDFIGMVRDNYSNMYELLDFIDVYIKPPSVKLKELKSEKQEP